MPTDGEKTALQGHLALLVLTLAAFPPLMLRLWHFATCGGACGADSFLGLFSDTLAGCAFLALVLACPRVLRWLPLLLWALFQVGSQELYQAMQRYPVWQDLRYLFDADFVRNSTSSFRLATPLFTAVLLLSAVAASLMRLPRMRLRHLAWALPALAVFFFVHARLEAGSSHTVTANRNPVHNFVLDAAYGSQRSSSNATAVALPASLRQADLSGAPLLGRTGTRAKNVLIVIMEGIPGLYIPEIREAMGAQDHSLTMEKLAGETKDAMLIPDFAVHSHLTIRGLYAILCGDFSKLSNDTPKAFELLNHPERAAACLPAQLAQRGFTTHFLQAADLGFMSKDRVMPAVGFTEVHGLEWFEEQKLENQYDFSWGMVDKPFFQGAYRYISQLRQGKQPWMLTLLTVGTHHPFNVPDAIAAQYPSRRDATVALLDEAVTKFLGKLRADGVMEDTLVIITSDESHGALHGDWVSSLGIHMVLAPEQRVLPRIKPGGYGLLDVEASVLDYLNLPVPAEVIGRSYFRDYDTPREMFSFTSMALRRHTGSTSIKCAGGNACVGWQATSILSQPPQDVQGVPPHLVAETYAMASALDNVLHAGSKSDIDGALVRIDTMAGNDANMPQGELPPLVIAAQLGDTDRIRALIEQGVDINAASNRGMTALMMAAFENHANIIEMLLDRGANVHATTARKKTALSYALGKKNVEISEILLARGADPNAELGQQLIGGHLDMAQLLLAHGADINLEAKGGKRTRLMTAVFLERENLISFLLDNGANTDIVNTNGDTALSIALDKKRADIAETLLAKGASANAALIPASWRGKQEVVQFLLEHGADINYAGGVGVKRTPLMHAAYYGHKDLVAFLLSKGANANARDAVGLTALRMAGLMGYNDIVKILKEAGAHE